MRNGTIRRTPQGLSWVWTLLLALFVALFTVGCGGTSAQSDADTTVVETETTESDGGVTVAEEPETPEASAETGEPDARAEAQADVQPEVQPEAEAEVQAEPETEVAAETENAVDLTRSRPQSSNTAELNLPESGTYTSKDEVAWYLHTYGHLPSNFVTKKTAENAGWKTQGLTIDEACPGKSIGGDRFGNYEGLLPDARGRKWYECDIDYHGGKSRGAKRIVYSSDGLIYYTGDHYNSFDRIY